MQLILPPPSTEGKPRTPSACIESEEKFCCRVYPSQICMMNTVCHVKIFSFFPSCVAPIETGGIGVNWMLNSCTRLGNPEAYIMWTNQDFVTIWASHGPHPQPHCPLFLKQLSEKSTKSYTNGCKP